MSVPLAVAEPTRLAEPEQDAAETVESDEGLYTRVLVSRRVNLAASAVSSDMDSVIVSGLRKRMEGRCGTDGYVKPGSVQLQRISAGKADGALVEYHAAITMEVCLPVEGQKIRCVAKDVTKAGVRCAALVTPSPVVIFIARDHHAQNEAFQSITPGDELVVEVLGQRFELGDEYVAVIARLPV